MTVRTATLFLLFFLSGATGLIYELIWVRQLTLLFGGTTHAITTVLVAFMGGLGVGSYFAGRWAAKLISPGRSYGLIEIAIGIYAVLAPWMLALADPLYRYLYTRVIDYPWLLTAARFSVGCVVMLIPTTLMGATLPILVRQLTFGGGAGRSIGRLFGVNTLGAFVGTTLAGFWLLPRFGLAGTTRLAAGANLLLGMIAVWLFRGSLSSTTVTTSPIRRETSPALRAGPSLNQLIVLGVFALSGFCSMAYQITWTRTLIMSLGSTTYAFTCILGAFIAGLAIGSLVFAKWVDGLSAPVIMLGYLQLGVGLLAAMLVPVLGHAPILAQRLVAAYHENYSELLAFQMLLVMMFTFLPTALMGAMWPLVARLVAGGDDAAPAAATGRAYLANTIGTVLGSFAAGFFLIRSDVLGVRNTIIAAAVMNALAGGWLIGRRNQERAIRVRSWAWPIGAAALSLLIALTAGRWNRELMTSAPFLRYDQPGEVQLVHKVLFYEDGADLTAAVAAWPGEDFLSLTVNGKADASTDAADMITMLLVGHIPAALDRDGGKACVIGLGSGLTVGSLARHEDYSQIDCVELSREVIRAAEFFRPYTFDVLSDPRVRIIHADGRNHLLLTDRTYDLIISQPSNPWIAGVSSLFTREFFELCRKRLKSDGLLGVWVQGYRMSFEGFATVVRTLQEVFPAVSLWELSADRDYLFIASASSPRVPIEQVITRLARPAALADLCRVGESQPEQTLGRFMASDETLRQLSSAAPINTDDNSLLEYLAPRSIYLTREEGIAREIQNLRESNLTEWIVADSADAMQSHVARRTNEVRRARSLRWTGLQTWNSGGMAGIIAGGEMLAEAQQLDPNNMQLRELIEEVRNRIRFEAPQLVQEPRIKAFLDQFDSVPPPILAEKRGSHPERLARMFTERTLQESPSERSVDALAAAARLLPDDRSLSTQWVNSLIAMNREQDAAAVNRQWLQRHPNELDLFHANDTKSAPPVPPNESED